MKVKRALTLLLAAGCGVGTYFASAPAAYAQRGYMAYGGEVLLGIAVAWTVACIGFALIRWHAVKKEDTFSSRHG